MPEDITADSAVTRTAARHGEYFAVIILASMVGLRLKAVVFIGRVTSNLQRM